MRKYQNHPCDIETRQRPEHPAPGIDEKFYNALPIPSRVEDQVTREDLARGALGGPKGGWQLPPVPVTQTRKEQSMFSDDPGQVAASHVSG